MAETMAIPQLEEDAFEQWKVAHDYDIRTWFAKLPDFEKIMWVLTANDADSEYLLMAEKPWKWAAEAYATFLRHQDGRC